LQSIGVVVCGIGVKKFAELYITQTKKERTNNENKY